MAISENTCHNNENNKECGGSNSNTRWTCSTDAIKRVKYHKIMRRSDFIKILFVCVCVCHVCPAHPCGSNPMNILESFSSSNGIAPTRMLQVWETNSPGDYSNFMAEYRRYNECMRMLHTGYFKRSLDNSYNQRRRETASLSDILSGSARRRHKRYGKLSSRALRELLSRDSYVEDDDMMQLESWEDSPIIETETVPEELLEETLPLLLKKLYKRNQDVAVILVEPANMEDPVSENTRRNRRRRRHR